MLKVKLLTPTARLPTRAHDTDVGYDLYVDKVSHDHDNVYKVEFNIAVQPPAGYFTQLYPRSSIHKSNCMMANSVGIIDPDYTGPICMLIRADTAAVQQLPEVGERFGQLVIQKICNFPITTVDTLDTTTRGDGGFGSSGKF